MLGIVMAGGLSQRMGQDKAQLCIYGADMPNMLERTGQLLARHVDEVVISARSGREATNYPIIYDEREGLGPAGGLYSVLRARCAPMLVLSCDLPFMDDATVLRLLKAHENRQAQSVMTCYQQQESGHIETLVAVYEPECLAYFNDALAKGVRKLQAIIPCYARTHITYSKADALPFFNMNSGEDLKKAGCLAQLMRRTAG